MRYLAVAILACLSLGIAHAQQSTTEVKPQGDERQHLKPQVKQGTEKQVAVDAPGWLGLKIAPVPKALSVHLKLKEKTGSENGGVMILNVSKNGPAHRAGIDRYDVIYKINGEAISGDFKELVKMLAELRAGDIAKIDMISSGETQVKTVELRKAMPLAEAPYLYDRLTHQLVKSFSGYRGGLLKRTERGWDWQDYKEGDPDVLAKLPPRVRYFSHLWKDSRGTGLAKSSVRVIQDNLVIDVEVKQTGEIIVKRTLKTAVREHVQKQEYKDSNALSKGDEIAYMVYQKMKKPLPKGAAPDKVAEAVEASQPLKRSFKDLPGGKIEVTLQRGSQEIKQVFPDARALRDENPGLHDYYIRAKSMLLED